MTNNVFAKRNFKSGHTAAISLAPDSNQGCG